MAQIRVHWVQVILLAVEPTGGSADCPRSWLSSVGWHVLMCDEGYRNTAGWVELLAPRQVQHVPVSLPRLWQVGSRCCYRLYCLSVEDDCCCVI